MPTVINDFQPQTVLIINLVQIQGQKLLNYFSICHFCLTKREPNKKKYPVGYLISSQVSLGLA